jgi:predicted GIY-YIG superfamily endonuclease
MMYYVYILKWIKYYCWSTNDIKRRLAEHRRWSTQTTKILQATELIGYFKVLTEQEARGLEKKIKASKNIWKRTTYPNFTRNTTLA